MLFRTLCLAVTGVLFFPSKAQETLLDPGFGMGGVALHTMSPFGGDIANDVIVQPDGRILIVGGAGGEEGMITVLRLSDNSELDPTFSGDGRTQVSIGETSEGQAITLYADGRLMVVGNATFAGSFDDMAFARFLPNGALDTTFSGDGRTVITRSTPADALFAVALDGEERIITAGKLEGNNSDMVAVRLLPDGSPDPAFAAAGLFVTQEHVGEVAEDFVLRSDGGITLVGAWRLGQPDADLAVLQLDANGTMDEAFGVDGMFRPSEPGSTSAAIEVEEVADGKLLILGKRYSSGSPEQIFMGRITATGEWDVTYGSGGRSFLPVGPPFIGFARDMVVLPDGKALVTTDVVDTSNGEASILVMRVLANGTLDAAFGTNGRVFMPCPGGGCSIRSLANDGQGRVVATGTYLADQGSAVLVMRWLPEASPIGVEERIISSTFEVYPNPTTGVLNLRIDVGHPAEQRHLTVADVSGRILHAQRLGATATAAIALPGELADGLYHVFLSSDAGALRRSIILRR